MNHLLEEWKRFVMVDCMTDKPSREVLRLFDPAVVKEAAQLKKEAQEAAARWNKIDVQASFIFNKK